MICSSTSAACHSPAPFPSCWLHLPISRQDFERLRPLVLAPQYITVLSVTSTGEPASNFALPRAISQPSARSRRATICSVGEAVELAGGDKENSIALTRRRSGCAFSRRDVA